MVPAENGEGGFGGKTNTPSWVINEDNDSFSSGENGGGSSGGGSSSGGSSSSGGGSVSNPTPSTDTSPNYGDSGNGTQIDKIYFPIIIAKGYSLSVYSSDYTTYYTTNTSSNFENYEWRELFEIGLESLIFKSRIMIPYDGSWPRVRDGYQDTEDVGNYSLIVQIISNSRIFTADNVKMNFRTGATAALEFGLNIGYGTITETKLFWVDISDLKNNEDDIKLKDTDIFGDGVNNPSDNFEIKCIIYNTEDVYNRVENPAVIETSLKITKFKEEVDGEIRYRPYITYKSATQSDYFGDLSKLTNGGDFIETRLNVPFGIKSTEKTVYLKYNNSYVSDILNPKLYYVDDPDYLWIYFDTYSKLESVSLIIQGEDATLYTGDPSPIQLLNELIPNEIKKYTLSVDSGSSSQYSQTDGVDFIECQKIKLNNIKNRYILKTTKDKKSILNNAKSIFITFNLYSNEFINKDNVLLDINGNSNASIEFINTTLKLNQKISNVSDEFKKVINLRRVVNQPENNGGNSSGGGNNHEFTPIIDGDLPNTRPGGDLLDPGDLPNVGDLEDPINHGGGTGGNNSGSGTDIQQTVSQNYTGILCGIFNITGNIIGDLSVYYGTEKIFNGNDYLILNSDLSKTFENNNIDIFYLYEIKSGIYGYKVLYIYVYGIDDKTLNKKISIYLNEVNTSSETTTSNIISSNNGFDQKTLSYYEIDINKPEITSDNEIVYIDDSIYGKTHHYTYITEIETENGKKYYGVRAKKRIKNSNNTGEENESSFEEQIFTNDLYKLGIDGLTYNVHAKVVPLQSRSENYNIYSFTNGEQLVTLNQSALNIYGSKDDSGIITWYNIGVGNETNEMLPSYIYSYSYIIEGKVPQEPNSDYLIQFTSLKGNRSLKEISNGEIGNYNENNVYMTLSYVQTEILEEGKYVYTKINNFGNGELLTNNINRSEEINTYEYSYSEIDEDYSDYENLYKLTYEYIKITPSILTLDLFKTAITRYYSTEDSRDDTIYYKYISSSKEYIKYTLADIKKLKELPLNIYAKSYYYLKLSSDSIKDDSITKYKKDFEYIAPDDISSSEEEFLYAKVENVTTSEENPEEEITTISYVPIRNKFINDGTEEYYSYIYSEVTNEDIELSLKEETFPYDSLYVKQKYELIKNPTPNLIARYNNNKVNLYTLESSIKSTTISDDETIYNLDLSGNTIYSDNEGKIIPLENIITIYSNLMKDQNTPSENEILNDKVQYQNYFITNLSGVGDDKKINNRISLEGNYTQPTFNKISAIIDGRDSDNLYIEGESYVSILSSNIGSVEETKDLISRLKRYNVKLYTKKFGKLRTDDFKYLSNEDDVFIYLGTELKKINKDNGIPFNTDIYERKYLYTQSFDLNMSKNKDYFSYSNKIISIGNLHGLYPQVKSKYNSSKKRITTGNENLIQEVTQIKYYINEISYYTYNPYFVNLVSQFGTLTTGDSDYEPEIFFKTKYLYEDFSINDGINLDTNGSYYTTISLFDGKNGKAAKKMYLNTHLRTATKYSYDYIEEGDYRLSNANSELLSSLDPSQYNEYYIMYNNGGIDEVKEVLNERSESPAYFVTQSSYSLFTHYSESKHAEYTGESNEVNDGNSSWQFFDKKNKLPITVLHDNELFGIIFGEDPYTNHSTQILTFVNGDKFLQNGSNFVVGALPNQITVLDKDDKETINNELYYNDYTSDNVDPALVKKYTVTYKPDEYEYEIVELKRFIFRKSSSFKTKYSERDYEIENISVEKPFVISNAEKIEFDGTYNWVEPEYTNIIDSYGYMVEIISKDGYWKKNYERKSVPFKVASYNYYDKNDVSSINISYNFVPNSYIITAQIDHPKISYDYLVNSTEELVRYSYIINGFEYDYPLDYKVSYTNGSYYGIIKEKYYVSDDFSTSGNDNNITYTKVKLYRRKELVTNTNVKNIVNQDKFTSYEYFTYYQATPLTNEKVPVLYNTELIPAKTKRVQYWDISKNSYSIKNVVSSYAYYSYKYIYETVPFKVASYIYTDDFTISNFNTLGSYISDIGEVVGYSVDAQKESIEKFDIRLDTNINKFIDIYSSYNTYGIERIDTSISKLYENVYTLSDTSYSVLSTLRDNITYSINSLSNGSKDTVNEFRDKLVDKIGEQHASIKDGFEKQTSTLEKRLTDLHDVIHTDILGEGSVKEESLSYTIYTYTPIYADVTKPVSEVNDLSGENNKLISGYSVSTTTGSMPVTKGGNSIGEILTNIFSTTGTQTYTEYHDDNSYTVSTLPTTKGLGEILSNLTIIPGIPKYNEFMVDLVPKLFSSVDFENASNIEYDSEGNVISRTKHNPTDIAKKCIYRADILWNELKKKGVVS